MPQETLDVLRSGVYLNCQLERRESVLVDSEGFPNMQKLLKGLEGRAIVRIGERQFLLVSGSERLQGSYVSARKVDGDTQIVFRDPYTEELGNFFVSGLLTDICEKRCELEDWWTKVNQNLIPREQYKEEELHYDRQRFELATMQRFFEQLQFHCGAYGTHDIEKFFDSVEKRNHVGTLVSLGKLAILLADRCGSRNKACEFIQTRFLKDGKEINVASLKTEAKKIANGTTSVSDKDNLQAEQYAEQLRGRMNSLW